jgi:hypothetical protein
VPYALFDRDGYAASARTVRIDGYGLDSVMWASPVAAVDRAEALFIGEAIRSVFSMRCGDTSCRPDSPRAGRHVCRHERRIERRLPVTSHDERHAHRPAAFEALNPCPSISIRIRIRFRIDAHSETREQRIAEFHERTRRQSSDCVRARASSRPDRVLRDRPARGYSAGRSPPNSLQVRD